MKAIAQWASNNVYKSRILLVLLHSLGLITALIAGFLLFAFDINVNSLFILLFGGIYFAGYYFYPSRTSKSSYLKRKTYDFIVVFSCFMIITLGFNDFLSQPDINRTIPKATFIVNKENIQKKNQEYNSPLKKIRKEAKLLKRNVKKESRLLKKKLQKKGGEQPVVPVLLILLVILSTSLVIGGIIGLSCSLSCSGNPGLATVVLIVGGVGVILASIFFIKNILKKHKLKNKQVYPKSYTFDSM